MWGAVGFGMWGAVGFGIWGVGSGRAGVWPVKEERPVVGRCIGFGSVLNCRISGPDFPKSDNSGEAGNLDLM